MNISLAPTNSTPITGDTENSNRVSRHCAMVFVRSVRNVNDILARPAFKIGRLLALHEELHFANYFYARNFILVNQEPLQLGEFY
jgi:hypothetical protein